MGEIKGIYAAGVSIFNKDLSLNIDKTIFHAEKLIQNGCHGVVVFGSTGQAQLISVQEKIQLINKLSKNKFNSKFIIGTGGYIEQIRALGPDPMLESEAKRIISLLPKFIPAINSDGKTVSVPFTVPITFGLGI